MILENDLSSATVDAKPYCVGKGNINGRLNLMFYCSFVYGSLGFPGEDLDL